jgi:hypothetical protein
LPFTCSKCQLPANCMGVVFMLLRSPDPAEDGTLLLPEPVCLSHELQELLANLQVSNTGCCSCAQTIQISTCCCVAFCVVACRYCVQYIWGVVGVPTNASLSRCPVFAVATMRSKRHSRASGGRSVSTAMMALCLLDRLCCFTRW